MARVSSRILWRGRGHWGEPCPEAKPCSKKADSVMSWTRKEDSDVSPLSCLSSSTLFPQFPSWFCHLVPFTSSLLNSYQYIQYISLLVAPPSFEWLHLNSAIPVLTNLLLSTKCWTSTFWKLLTEASALLALRFQSSRCSVATLWLSFSTLANSTQHALAVWHLAFFSIHHLFPNS